MRIFDNTNKTHIRGHFMPIRLPVASPKCATNITLPESQLVEAKTLDINISKAAEIGGAQAVSERCAEIWRLENQEAITSSNAYAEEHGLPLRRTRMF